MEAELDMPQKPDIDTSSGALLLDLATLDRNDLVLSALEQLAAPLYCFQQTTGPELAARKTDAWCVITNKVYLGREFFEARPALRLVCIMATGTNNVDLDAAAGHSVAVVNCRDYCTESLAQHTLMLILALLRSLPQYHVDVTAGLWSRSPMFCLLDHAVREVDGLRLGIVGYGAIGQEVSRLAGAIGMNVIVSERPGQPVREGRIPFDEMLDTCDVISLHCPLTSETRNMIDAAALRRMRKDAFLINTSRGGLVDEEALVTALSEGWIAGAALDVLNSEPPPADTPLLKAKLNNLIITPHCAWTSRQARQRVIDQTTENISAWLEGRRLRRVV